MEMEFSSMCNVTNISNFVFMVNTFRIIVLTYNRPRSLHRLLRSLEDSHYNFPKNNPNWNVVLEIRVDGGGGDEGRLVQNVARNFKFSHGIKSVIVSDSNRGIMDAWKHAWSWRDRELFIIIEDDVEMSPWWYRALVNMWTKYGDREYIAGIGLQNQQYITTEDKHYNISGEVSDSVYFYELPCSIGSSPHPCHWTKMIHQYGHNFGNCPDNMACRDQVWESWFLKYHQENVLYTLYAANQDAFAVDHRESGYHHRQSIGPDSAIISSWRQEREFHHLPDSPPLLDLWLKNNRDGGGYQARKLLTKYQVLLTRFVTCQEDIDDFKTNINKLSSMELEGTLFIVPSEEIKNELKLLGILSQNIGFQSTKNNSTMISREKFILGTLRHLSSYGQKIVTLPYFASALDLMAPETISVNIGAWKTSGQRHIRLDWLYLDGTFPVFSTFNRLYHIVNSNTEALLHGNFLSNFTNTIMTKNAITWTWM